MVDMRRQLQHIECQFHIHIAFNTPFAGFRIGKFTGQFADNGKSIVIQPVNQRAQRRKFLILGKGGVIIGADQIGVSAEITMQLGVIDIHVQCPRRRVKI